MCGELTDTTGGTPVPRSEREIFRGFLAGSGYSLQRHIMKSPELDDSLSRALADWQLTPERNPQFRPSVWARIAAARRPATWVSFARAHLGALAAAVTVALLVGGWAGREQARAAVEADREQLARAYVQSLDARAMWMP